MLALPLIIFRLNQPEAIGDHLRMVNTYWLQDLPLSQKIGLYLQKYAYGLSPQYWFLPNAHDLARHRMLGIAHIPTLLLPFVLLGAGICLYNFRSSPHRAILIAALATPVGAALVDVGIARVLAFIVPAGLLAGLGLSAAAGVADQGQPGAHPLQAARAGAVLLAVLEQLRPAAHRPDPRVRCGSTITGCTACSTALASSSKR